jgi:Mn2+/Fe2+ NRAMP family transporter
LGELAVKRFHRTGRAVLGVLLIVLIVANALNIAADVVAIGSGMSLLNAGPTWLWALLAGGAITLLLVIGSFARIALVFKVLCAPLLAYVVVAILVTHQWGRVLSNTFVPHIQLNKTYLALLVAVLGTTISPYLFFWQSAHRIEEMRDAPEGGAEPVPLKRLSRRRAGKKERMSRLDVFTGMAFSNVVMFAIIVATAQTLHIHHLTHIQSAAEAAKALRPFAGRFASAIFALGFIGSGLLAVPVLAASGSVGMAGLLGKEWGFSRSIRQAPVFYGLLASGTVGGTALSLLNVNPIKLLVLVAVINGVAAAPFLFVVMRVSSSHRLMGKHVNGLTANILGWLTAAIMAAAAIALFATGGL